MGFAQLTVIIWLTVRLTWAFAKHGLAARNYNGWEEAVRVIFMMFLLCAGGFYK